MITFGLIAHHFHPLPPSCRGVSKFRGSPLILRGMSTILRNHEAQFRVILIKKIVNPVGGSFQNAECPEPRWVDLDHPFVKVDHKV